MRMSPEGQRIAIAEACPNLFWVHRQTAGLRPWGRVFWLGEHPGQGDSECDPLSDLNAMHEAESILDVAEQVRYLRALTEDHRKSIFASVVHATAAQRAEAFLRATNKWDDSK